MLETAQPVFASIRRAICEHFDAAIKCGDVEITITENWDDFSTSMRFPHFAHIRVVEKKPIGSHNSCEIKFNDFIMKNYFYSCETKQKVDKATEFNEDGINSVYFEIV